LSQCRFIDRGETQSTDEKHHENNKQNCLFDHLTSPYKIDANAAAPFHADRIKYIHAQPVRPSSAATVQALQNNTAKTVLRNNINILFFLTVQFFQFHEN
jgi:2-keto-3-deoxy-L-rhamnonate aldolase RhmA